MAVHIEEVRCPYSGKLILEPSHDDEGRFSQLLTWFTEEMISGSGAFGCVVKCHNKLDGRSYAVKKVKLTAEFDSTREVIALSLMDHPNVVRYYFAWVENNVVGKFEIPEAEEDEKEDLGRVDPKTPCLYILQEFYPSSLKKLLDERENELDTTLAWKIFHQVLLGVEHIHSKHVRHGDLSPSNIFLDKDNNVKIGDFGLASLSSKNMRRLPKDEPPVADNSYAAPELKTRHACLASDLYSLGMIMFELFHQLTTGMERAIAFSFLKKKEFPKTSLLSPGQKSLLLRLIDEDPTRRSILHEVFRAEPWKDINDSKEAKFLADG